MASGRIGQTQTHFLDVNPGDRIANKPIGRGQPDEFNTLFLSVLGLTQRSRHICFVAAVKAFDGGGALPDRCAHAIHCRVAAANDHNPLAGRIQAAIFEFRHGVAKTMAIAGGQIVNGFYNAIRS